MGTREGIFNLRTICERTLEVNQHVYICFIDYKKAFARVNNSKMIECSSGIGADRKDLRIIAKMYWEQTGIVRIEGGVTSQFKIKKGVMQGCVLFSSLFNHYTEQIFRDVGVMKGVTVGGANINNLRYADDTALLTCNEEDLVTAVNDKEKRYWMEMNVMKTKTMVISRSNTKNQHLK